MPEPELHPFSRFRHAVFHNRAEAERLLEHDPTLLEIRSPHMGETVLHWASIEQLGDDVLWLLARGATINPLNDFDDTPLMDAVRIGVEKWCAFLLEHGADVRHITGDNSVHKSALEVAADAGNVPIALLLLSYVPPTDDLSRYFDPYVATRVLENGDAMATLLRERGLQAAVDDTEA